MDFRYWLDAFMRNGGWTQASLGKALGVAQVTVGALVNGKNLPDAHNLRNRSPNLSHARQLVAERLGEQAATDMVLTRPRGVLDNAAPSSLPSAVGVQTPPRRESQNIFRRLFKAAS